MINLLSNRASWVADPSGVDPNPDPTYLKKQDPDLTFKKHLDPGPTPCLQQKNVHPQLHWNNGATNCEF